MKDKPKNHSVKRSDGRTVQVTVPENPKPEELLDDALRDNLSPEAIAVIVAYLQPAKSKDAGADAQVRWFADRLVALLPLAQAPPTTRRGAEGPRTGERG